MSAADHKAAFIAAMEAAGVGPADPIAHLLMAGKLIRYRVVGDRPGRENGWAVYHDDGRPAGAFGCNKRQITDRWKADGAATPLSPAERRQRLQQYRDARAARQRELTAAWEATARRAQASWDRAGQVDRRHPYLVKKAIVGEGLRQSGNLLLVPMRDVTGRVWNLQLIDPTGTKRFLKGGRVNELMFVVGNPASGVCVGEGVATMAAVRRATGRSIAAAFNAKNLQPVAVAIRSEFPSADIVLCADDDAHLVDHPQVKRNVGLEAAREAATAAGARVAQPIRGEYA